MNKSQKLTPSIRKSIVALSQHLNYLNQERVKCEEELSYWQNAMNIIKKKKEKQEPIINKMMGPIQKLQEKADQNSYEIDEIKSKNDELMKNIAEIEETLATGITSVEGLQKSTNYIESNLKEYQIIFSELFQPFPLPYPYTIDSEINWAIANQEKIILEKYQHELCEKIHNCSGDFNTLPFTDKEYVISLLRKCRIETEEIVKGIRKADIQLSGDQKKHDSVVRQALKKYAVIALSMQKIIF